MEMGVPTNWVDSCKVYGIKTSKTRPDGSSKGEEEVSFHLPLHRFLVAGWMEILRYHGGQGLEIAEEFNALILSSCGPQILEGLDGGVEDEKGHTWQMAGFSSQTQAFLLFMLEYPLRILVALAETQAGLWVRNGVVMPGQTKYYTCPHLSPHTYQLDISALQLATCALPGAGADQLMGILLAKFRLREWVWGGMGAGVECAQGGQRLPVEAEKLVSLLGELLALIIMILCERGLVAPATDEEDVRLHLIQRLASGACTHSNLLRALPPRIAEHPLKDKVLKDVSIFRPPTATRSGDFDLKPALLSQVNPFSCHLSRRDRQNILERVHAASTNTNDKDTRTANMLSFVTFPPAPPCLRPLGSLIVSPVLWRLLATLLDTACEHLLGDASTDSSAAQAGQLLWVNDTCLQQALHLMALAISAANQDKATQHLGGCLWEQLAAHVCGSEVGSRVAGTPAEPGQPGEGRRTRRRRSVVESLVLLQSPAKARGGGAADSHAQHCRFQRELHKASVQAILGTHSQKSMS